MISRFLQNTLGYSFIQSNSETPPQRKDLLPSEIVGRILQLEMQCEQATATPQLVSELVVLYADAFDYYERQGSSKCHLYQKRMHHFLSKNSIDSLMKGNKSHLIVNKERVERKRQQAIMGSRQQAQRIIDRSVKKAENNRTRINKQIDVQQKTLNARIQRRKSMSNRSTKTDNEDQCDDLFLKKGVFVPSGNLVFEGFNPQSSKKVFI